VFVSLQAFARLPPEGDSVRVDVVTHMREDALVLFGFLDSSEKLMFNWLRGVSGVGPKLALNVLSGMPAEDLRTALAEGDLARLCRIPGVGKKLAERLVLELRERARTALLPERREPGAATPESARDEVLSALLNLGYKRSEAERVLESIGPELPLEEALREALRRFAR
jgi:Holliday junction DNA helicase RuvA